MKKIQLDKGLVTLVDNQNYLRLNKFNWHADKHGYTYYAVRSESVNGKWKTIYMHREIMKTPDNLTVDHRDHNGLNNQESNLRNCKQSQNQLNKSPYGKSQYRGVSISIYKGKNKTSIYIHAAIQINNRLIHLGNFKTEESAAMAYDKAAKIFHGQYANLNFKHNE